MEIILFIIQHASCAHALFDARAHLIKGQLIPKTIYSYLILETLMVFYSHYGLSSNIKHDHNSKFMGNFSILHPINSMRLLLISTPTIPS